MWSELTDATWWSPCMPDAAWVAEVGKNINAQTITRCKCALRYAKKMFRVVIRNICANYKHLSIIQ